MSDVPLGKRLESFRNRLQIAALIRSSKDRSPGPKTKHVAFGSVEAREFQ